MSKPQKPGKEESYDKFNLANACSAGDCTGLIPTPPMTEEEEESYMYIYDYRPPDATHVNAEQEQENKKENS